MNTSCVTNYLEAFTLTRQHIRQEPLDLPLHAPAMFGASPVPFDGEAYHFHATAVIDHATDSKLGAMTARAGERFDLRTTAHSLGLFIFTDADFALASFVSYKTLTLEFKTSSLNANF